MWVGPALEGSWTWLPDWVKSSEGKVVDVNGNALLIEGLAASIDIVSWVYGKMLFGFGDRDNRTFCHLEMQFDIPLVSIPRPSMNGKWLALKMLDIRLHNETQTDYLVLQQYGDVHKRIGTFRSSIQFPNLCHARLVVV